MLGLEFRLSGIQCGHMYEGALKISMLFEGASISSSEAVT